MGTRGPLPAVRVDWQPLERLIERRCRARGSTESARGVDRTTRAVAEWAGVRRETITRWRRRGVPRERGEHLAFALGLDPTMIWTEGEHG